MYQHQYESEPDELTYLEDDDIVAARKALQEVKDRTNGNIWKTEEGADGKKRSSNDDNSPNREASKKQVSMVSMSTFLSVFHIS